MYMAVWLYVVSSGLENLIKSQKDKLAELQEHLRAKEADLEKVVSCQIPTRPTMSYIIFCVHPDQGAV